MTIMTVLYPYEEGKTFDEEYFHGTHVPLLREVWGDAVTDVRVLHGEPGPGGAPQFVTIAEVEFASTEAFQQAMAKPRSAEVQADVPNYAQVVPTVQISRKR